MIQQAIASLVNGSSLSTDEAAGAMIEIMGGDATPAQFGAFVTALRIKGESAEELAGMARVMREKSLHVDVEGPLVDTSGTGGDALDTFSISTTAAFVVAGAGVRVAKHGNRAASSACGSADVLEVLGAKIDLGPEGVQRCLQEVGFGFMFAPVFHPSMRFAAGPRREIGIRTVFNILGPLTNPAGARSQLIGVADPNIGESMAKVLGMLGGEHALVVHGLDGLDEITLADSTQIWELKDGVVSSYAVTPEELGFSRVLRSELRVHNPQESAQVLREVLEGGAGPTRNVVVVNAAGAFLAADRTRNLKEGIVMAAKSIDSGSANSSLDAFIELSQKLE